MHREPGRPSAAGDQIFAQFSTLGTENNGKRQCHREHYDRQSEERGDTVWLGLTL